MSIQKELPNKGKVNIDKNILPSIIYTAANEINGVVKLTNKGIPLSNRLIKKDKTDGVRVRFDSNNTVTIDIYAIVKKDCNVPDLASKVQDNVNKTLWASVGLKPKKINFHVVGAYVDDEWAGI